MRNEQLKTVEMTRRIRDRMYDDTKDLDPEEFLRYVKQRAEAASQKVAAREAIGAAGSSRITDR